MSCCIKLRHWKGSSGPLMCFWPWPTPLFRLLCYTADSDLVIRTCTPWSLYDRCCLCLACMITPVLLFWNRAGVVQLWAHTGWINTEQQLLLLKLQPSIQFENVEGNSQREMRCYWMDPSHLLWSALTEMWSFPNWLHVRIVYTVDPRQRHKSAIKK